MNFWMRINTRWDSDKLYSFSSWFRIIYLLFPLIVYYLAGDVVEVVLWAVLDNILGRASDNFIGFATTYSGSIRAIIYSIGLAVSVAIICRMARNEISYVPDGESTPSLNIKQIGILVGISLLASVGINYIFNLTGLVGRSEAYTEVYEAQYSVSFGVGLIVYGIVSPFVEEIIFRGIIFNRMKRIFPRLMAIIVSALLFGLFHGNVIQGLYAFMMGLLLVWFYDRYRHFMAPVIIHIVANVSVYLLDYLNIL